MEVNKHTGNHMMDITLEVQIQVFPSGEQIDFDALLYYCINQACCKAYGFGKFVSLVSTHYSKVWSKYWQMLSCHVLDKRIGLIETISDDAKTVWRFEDGSTYEQDKKQKDLIWHHQLDCQYQDDDTVTDESPTPDQEEAMAYMINHRVALNTDGVGKVRLGLFRANTN